MVTFFITTLLLSMVGMIAVLMLKRYELTSGKVVFSSLRPSIGSFLQRLYVAIREVLPLVVRRGVHLLIQKIRSLTHQLLARGVLLVEYVLEKGLHIVREKTTHPPRAMGEASAFLREVADHKKKLMRRSAARRSISQDLPDLDQS